MCGIAGIIGRVPSPTEVAALHQLMHPRGPDAKGIWQGTIRGLPITLAHTRLSIIDLDERANQPFITDRCVIVFNGEIYNYRELRQELIAAGHGFETQSDTEVVAAAYAQWGPACVERFDGMWALALFDLRDETLLLSRDPFGEKPLHYISGNSVFAFGSETKYLPTLSGLSLTPDQQQLRRYLVNGYKALYKQPSSWFEETAELPAGTNAMLTEPQMPEPQTYWTLEYTPQPMSRADAEEGARERIRRALELRLRADVPIAFCLSGGVDSNVLACLAAREFDQEIHAFSIIDSDPRYNESDNIDTTVAALGCRHHVAYTSRDGFLDRLATQIAYHDSPVATISYYVHDFLSEAIAEHGYKVAISGTGADELFTGYYDHYGYWLAAMANRPNFNQLVDDWRDSYGAVVRNPVLKNPLTFVDDPDNRSYIYLDRDLFNGMMIEPLSEDFTEAAYTDDTLRNRMLNELRHESVPVLLHEDDLDSMRHSVENRSPYLDRELARFLFTVPGEHLIHEGLPKWLLRTAGAGVVPEMVRVDRRKRGFNASIDSVLDRSDPATREQLLAPSPIFDIVDRDTFTTFLEGDMTDNSVSKFLFSFVSAKLFLESDLARGQQPNLAAE